MTNSAWISVFQWMSLMGSTLALCSFLGLWVFTNRLENEKEKEILLLKYATEAVQTYSDVANLNPQGLPFGIGPGIHYNSPLSDALKNLYVVQGNSAQFLIDEALEPKFRAIVLQFPRFPFGHFALAECLRDRGDSEWLVHAERAREILEKTTIIAGHHKSHDEALALVRSYLSEK